jgi:hypothetical protein
LSASTNQASIPTQKNLADYGKQQNPGHIQHEILLLLLLLLQRRNREQGKAIAEEEHGMACIATPPAPQQQQRHCSGNVIESPYGT